MQIFDISKPFTDDILDFSGFPEGSAVYPAEIYADGSSALERYCGKCRLISCSEGIPAVLPEQLKGRIAGVKRLCLKASGKLLTEEAVNYIASCGVQVLVLDRTYVGDIETEKTFREILASAGVSVVINADFTDVPEGNYMLFSFPVDVASKIWLPVRPVLIPA